MGPVELPGPEEVLPIQLGLVTYEGRASRGGAGGESRFISSDYLPCLPLVKWKDDSKLIPSEIQSTTKMTA